MADPLTQLRDSIREGRAPQLENEEYRFGNARFYRKTITTYKSQKGGGEYYTLDALVFFFEHQSLGLVEYRAKCKENGFPVVSVVDRRDLISYLKGEMETCPSIIPFPEAILSQSSQSAIPSAEEGDRPSKKQRTDSQEPSISEEQIQFEKQHIADSLEEKLTSAIASDNIKALGEGMTTEKIAELKAKRIAKKRTTIKSTDDTADRSKEGGAFIQADAAVTKEIVSKERQLRTRTTILLARNDKKFVNVLQMLQDFRKKDLGGEENSSTAKKSEGKSVGGGEKDQSSQKVAVPVIPQSRYNAVDDSLFWKDRLGADIPFDGIDTGGSFAALGLAGRGPQATTPTNSSSTPALPPSSSSLSTTPASNSTALALPAPPRTSTSSTPSKPSRPPSSSTSSLTSKTPSSSNNPSSKSSSKSATTPTSTSPAMPIIVVPAALTSLITLYNAKDFLQDRKFVSFEEKKKAGAKKETSVIITHVNPKGATYQYQIIDNVAKLSGADWERVAAVFAMGVQWQFNDWPMKNPPDIFANFKGFHMMYDDEKVNSTISTWSVQVLTVSRHKRYLDHTAVMKFWAALDEFIQHKKPYLVPKQPLQSS